jgi:dCMP deaminase
MANQNDLDMLYMDIAARVALMSHAERTKVGCVIVKGDNILAMGWNGMPSGFSNSCEMPKQVYTNGKTYIDYVTMPEVLHAESNAIAKLARSTVSSVGSTAYVTLSPCMDCAKQLYQAGITRLVYRDEYRDLSGLHFLKDACIDVRGC